MKNPHDSAEFFVWAVIIALAFIAVLGLAFFGVAVWVLINSFGI